MAGLSFRLEGLEEALRRVRSLNSGVEAEDVEKALMPAAQVFRKSIREQAHRGPTGHLKGAVRAKKGKRRDVIASVFAAVDRKRAPHAGLVEGGHNIVVKGQIVGSVPPHPFFDPGVARVEAEGLALAEQGIRELLERTAR